MNDKIEKDFLKAFSGKKVNLNLAQEAVAMTKNYNTEELSYFHVLLNLAMFPTGVIMDELKTKHKDWYIENFTFTAGHATSK